MDEHKIFEKKISGSGNPISLESLELLFAKGKKCVCKIYYNGFATGFFCKIPIGNSHDNYGHVLFTNNHVLDSHFFNSKKYIDIEYLSESKIIDLTPERFKYCNELMDFTIIEIFPKDNIKDFFDLDEGLISKNSFYKGKDICIIQHPEGKEISFSQGEILDISGFKIKHSASTKEGSSGSPIILTDKMTVIGIHSFSVSNKNMNAGIYMKNIIEYLNQNSITNKIKSLNIKYSTDQKGSVISSGDLEIIEDNKIFCTGCPVRGCGNNKSLIKWMHECGVPEIIDENGIVKCKNNHILGEFYLFKYSCGKHQFEYGNFSNFLSAISICSHYSANFAFKIVEVLLNAFQNGKLQET